MHPIEFVQRSKPATNAFGTVAEMARRAVGYFDHVSCSAAEAEIAQLLLT